MYHFIYSALFYSFSRSPSYLAVVIELTGALDEYLICGRSSLRSHLALERLVSCYFSRLKDNYGDSLSKMSLAFRSD
jgi:hypothetical protein